MGKPSNKDIAKAFGQALRESRVAKGASQEEIALSAEMDRTYISWLERELRQPTLGTLFSVSEVVGVTPEALVTQTLAILGKRR
jgi:transcriptional regulator with XRE-family HTH domain